MKKEKNVSKKQQPKDESKADLQTVLEHIHWIISAQQMSYEKMESFKEETHSNFRTISEYLGRIEARVRREMMQIDIKELAALQKRVEHLEQVAQDIKTSKNKA